MLKILNAGLLMLMVSSCDCGPPACFDLVWNPTTETCDCPMGTMPNYDLDRCEGPDGLVIPWSEVEPAARPSRPMMDGGLRDASVDVLVSDAGPDGELFDAASRDMSSPDQTVDAGPLPDSVVARFPWNGFMTGSIHAREDEPLINHPLRPKFVWEPAPGANLYQIQLTRECGVSFQSCPFARVDLDETTMETVFRPGSSLPVARTRPVGSRYFWRVRSCLAVEACSDWSEVRYVDVGRDAHDFDGDGYADTIVGADALNFPETGEGAVHVFLGGAAGPAIAPSVKLDNPLDQAGGKFGHSVATAGDVNGDGYPDLLIGAPHQSNPQEFEGVAYLYFGGRTGIGSEPDVVFDNPLNQAAGRFGASLSTAGDVNGDGFADFLIGAPGQDLPTLDEGAAYLYLGRADGPSPSPSVVFDNPAPEEEGQFGLTLSGGADYDGDGLCDLTIGAPHQAAAFVYVGGLVIDVAPAVALSHTAPGLVLFVNPSNLGEPGDFNADGYADLVVGVPFESAPEVDEGVVHVFFGGPEGIQATPSATFDNPADHAGGNFGLAPSVADVNGDGIDDLIVGAPHQSDPERWEGALFVFLGSTGPDPWSSIQTIDSPDDEPFGNFGESISVSDVNGDGYVDIVSGAWSQPDSGAAFVFFGSPSGSSLTAGVAFTAPEQSGSNFGISVD